MRVMWLGTYDRAYPRARVLVAGLRAHGVEVVEHHRPVWEGRRDKTHGLRPLPLAASAARFTAAWAGLAVAGLRERDVDAVVAGYLAQPDVLPAWCVARARRKAALGSEPTPIAWMVRRRVSLRRRISRRMRLESTKVPRLGSPSDMK